MENDKTYSRVRRLVRVFVALCLPHRAEGLENIPAEGAFLLCSNHLSDLDPFVLVALLPRHIYFMAKQELFRIPVVRWIIRVMGAFPVDRGNADLAAIRTALGILKRGDALGIFPQGHRYKREENKTLQTGAALIALRVKQPVIPVQISMPMHFFRRGTVRVGKPVELSDLYGRLDSASLEEATRRIQAAIWPE